MKKKKEQSNRQQTQTAIRIVTNLLSQGPLDIKTLTDQFFTHPDASKIGVTTYYRARNAVANNMVALKSLGGVATKIPEQLPPRGEPTGGFKNYSDCTDLMSTTCCRPDCARCFKHNSYGQRWAVEEVLVAARFFQEISKHMVMSRPVPRSINRILEHFNPKFNGNADWNWTSIESQVATAVKKFWNTDY